MKVVLHTPSGDIGDISDWVARFSEGWAAGNRCTDQLVNLLGPDVRLVAPGLRSTRGRVAALSAFRKTFEVLPDLTAQVHRWSATGEALFLEMTFRATIGGRVLEWHSVDRVLFHDGVAVERVAYFNPLKVRRAFLRSPAGWLQLIRRKLKGL
ncbi:MAG TPA: nuclear transport factor 2 family protein [Geothrix sp.]|nr:nuclear transport factor 2 family protein [Geothrix sp.]